HNSAKKLNVVIDEDAAAEIACRARGTPRIANRLLRRVRDFAQVNASAGRVQKTLAVAAMDRLRIDGAGLDELDRKLLSMIYKNYKGGPVGVEALAATLNEEVDTIVDVVEPYLLKVGFLKRTARGRELTDTGLKHIKAGVLPDTDTQKKL